MKTIHLASLSLVVAACSSGSGAKDLGSGNAGTMNGLGGAHAGATGGETQLPQTSGGATESAGGAPSVSGAGGEPRPGVGPSSGEISPGSGGSAGSDDDGPGGETVDAAVGGGNAPVACAGGSWPAADPAKTGPFAVTTEQNVGPSTSYTLIRPTDLTQGCSVHPLVTWGNGTGTTPAVYSFLLDRLASHGFVVIASNSENVAQGTPPPMLDGVTWALSQNADSSSELYGHIDAAHIGATGHSQGALATMSAGADARIKTVAPIEGFFPGTLNGPALLLCGGQDLHSPGIGCDTAASTFASLTVPEMGAELLVADHTNWISASIEAEISGQPMSGFVTAVTGWMRVQLMSDANLRSMFYGPECTLCRDTADWAIEQKNLN